MTTSDLVHGEVTADARLEEALAEVEAGGLALGWTITAPLRAEACVLRVCGGMGVLSEVMLALEICDCGPEGMVSNVVVWGQTPQGTMRNHISARTAICPWVACEEALEAAALAERFLKSILFARSGRWAWMAPGVGEICAARPVSSAGVDYLDAEDGAVFAGAAMTGALFRKALVLWASC